MTWTTTVNPGAVVGYKIWAVSKISTVLKLRLINPTLLLLQRQPELQQSGGAGAAEAAGEAEGGGGGHGAQRGGAGQPAHPTSHGPQEPQQAVRRLAGVGVDPGEGVSLPDLSGASELQAASLMESKLHFNTRFSDAGKLHAIFPAKQTMR